MATIGTDIYQAKKLLLAEELVAIPTETVYGLAGNALSKKAILKIFETKNRPKFDPLIAHVDCLDKVHSICSNIPKKATLLSDEFWAGPLTLLLDKKKNVPDLLTSGLDRVAVRIPNHPLTLELLSKLDFPLAAPSANPFGYVSPTSAQHVANQLGDKISYILDGGSCSVGIESTIVGFEEDEVVVYRLGGASLEAIQNVVGEVKVNINQSSNPKAPGMLKSHYSPGKRLILGDIMTNLKSVAPDKTGIISFKTNYSNEVRKQIILSSSGDTTEAATHIFQALREMDDANIETVLAELLPEEGLGRAVNDRLKRAAV